MALPLYETSSSPVAALELISGFNDVSTSFCNAVSLAAEVSNSLLLTAVEEILQPICTLRLLVCGITMTPSIPRSSWSRTLA